MGTLAKVLGQWRSAISMQSLESESKSLFKGIRSNKVPGSLSLALDGTLKEGHDMKVFGLGTLATMSSREQYQQFLTNLHAVYSTMEEELDNNTTASSNTKPNLTISSVWENHGSILRREKRLGQDLDELQVLRVSAADNSSNGESNNSVHFEVSPKTLDYVQRIRQAGEMDRAQGSGLLLGHLYCRYFADLFGGQMLGKPYEFALQLPAPPQHLRFDFGANNTSRGAYLEGLYGDLNKAGERLVLPHQIDHVRQEALLAFDHNANVYSEEPNMTSNAVKGGMNIVMGSVKSFAK